MKNYKQLISWLTLSLAIGVIGGAIGSLFAHIIALATSLRQQYLWLIFLLPLGGLLTVKINNTLKTSKLGTNQVLLSLHSGEPVSPMLAISVFISTILTHLFGGSAGKEGAALQIGGGISSYVCKFLKIEQSKHPVVTICGMAALFSALFGTPLGAAVFCIEVFYKGKATLKALPFAVVSSYSAFLLSKGLLVHREDLSFDMSRFTFGVIWKALLVIICASAVCVIWVLALDLSKKYFKLFVKNDCIRIALGGCIIVALTLIIGSRDYNGGGMDVVEEIFTHSNVRFEAFLLKMLFTCVTIAAGFKGGEIVPTFFIGATYGASIGRILGIGSPFGAALGMIVLFSGATNCPLATLFIAIELFGFKGFVFYLLAAALSRVITGKKRLYDI